MLYRPLQALQSLTQFQELAPGDLILTGTPVGTALSAPPKPVEMIGNLLPTNLKWKVFFKRQAGNPKYLRTATSWRRRWPPTTDASTSEPSGNTVRFA